LSEEIDDEREDSDLKENEWNIEQRSGNDDCGGTIEREIFVSSDNRTAL